MQVRALIKKYNSMSDALRSSLWFTLCNFLQRGTALITVPIFTRLLTKSEYGICNVYFAWFEIFVLITSLKLPYEGLNNGLIRYEEDKDAFTSSIAGLILTMTFGFCVLGFLLRKPLGFFTGLNPAILIMLVFQLLFNPALMLWTGRERFDFKYRLPVLVTIISTILNPVISILAVLYTSYHAEARILGVVMVQTIFGLVCYLILFVKGKRFFHADYWKFALSFNLPLLLYYLSQSLLNEADRVMIGYIDGSGSAAVYSVAYSAATLVLIAVTAINGSFTPWMYKKMKSEDYDPVGKATLSLLILLGAATLAMIAFAPDLIRILATKDYAEAIWVIPPVSASVFFIFLYMVFAGIEMYYGENKPISLVSIAASVANLVLNAIFIPLFGYLAAGWTTLVCYAFLAYLHYRLMRKALKKHNIPHPLLHGGRILILSILVCLLSTFMLFTYRLGYARYLVILLELILAWGMRDRILGLFTQMKR